MPRGADTYEDGFEDLLRQAAQTPTVCLTPARRSMVGARLMGGRFVVQEKLGAGGMGRVYSAFDKKRRELVALKMLGRPDAQDICALKNEFRIVADWVHPNLVTLHELFRDDLEWFLSMEMVVGVQVTEYVRSGPGGGRKRADLAQRREAKQTCLGAVGAPGQRSGARAFASVDYGRLRQAMGQLALGVSAIHSAGKVHCDLKTSNVLVTAEGRVVILDFGLARDVRSTLARTWPAVVGGSPAYMAPEQFSDDTSTEASDWYAFGVMLYEALTGRLPCLGVGNRPGVHNGRADRVGDGPGDGRSHAPHNGMGDRMGDGPVNWPALWREKVEQAWEPPGAVGEDVPPDLDQLCQDLLQAGPVDRPRGPQVLRRLGVRPHPDHAVAASGSLADVGLVGREAELRALGEAFDSTRIGRPSIVFVHGSSGVGKTALLEAFTGHLQSSDRALVLRGRCHERESVPHKALDGLVDALGRYLAEQSREDALPMPRHIADLTRLFPALRRAKAVASAQRRAFETADAQVVRRRATAALKELLLRIRDRQPLVLWIDDLQWDDRDSAELLRSLLGSGEQLPLLFVGSYRSEAAGSSAILQILGPVVHAKSVIQNQQLVVEPLPQSDAQALALKMMGADDSAAQLRARAIAVESEGNPFFIRELVLHGASLEVGADSASTPAEQLTLRRVLLARVESLPPPAQQLLEVIAVAGGPVGWGSALRAAGLDRDARAPDLLRAVHLVRTQGMNEFDNVETYHDRVREIVVSHLSPRRLRECHRRLANVFEQAAHVDAERLAAHFSAASAPEHASQYWLAAADKAFETLAFERAARLFGMGLEHARLDTERKRFFHIKQGDALANAGRGLEAADIYLEAAKDARREQALELRRRAAEQLLLCGHIDRGLEVNAKVLKQMRLARARTQRGALFSLALRRAMVRLRGLHFAPRQERDIPMETLTRIDACWTIAAGLGMVDFMRGAEFQARHLLLSLRAGEPHRAARAIATEAAYAAASGVGAERRTARVLKTVEALAARMDDPVVEGLTRLAYGIAAYVQSDFGPSLEHCQKATEVFRERCTGVVWETVTAHRFIVAAMFYLGRFAELARLVPKLLDEAEHARNLYASTFFRATYSNSAWLVSDDVAQARRQIQIAREEWPSEGFQLQHCWLLVGEAYLDFYTGEHQAPWERIERQWPALTRAQLLRIGVIRVQMLHLRAASALHAAQHARAQADHRHFRRLLREAERAANKLARQRIRVARPLADLVRAGVAQARQDISTAIGTLRACSEQFERQQMLVYAAAARARCGELIGGQQGQELVAAAYTLMTERTIANPSRMVRLLVPGFQVAQGGGGYAG